MTDKRCPHCGDSHVEEIPKQEQSTAENKYACLACSKTFGNNKNSPEKHCDTFTFSYGGFFDGYQSLKIDEKDGYAELTVASPFSTMEGEGVRFRIMLSEWQDIKTTLFYDLFILDWKDEYKDPYILDGTQWELSLAFDDREKVLKSGSNAYPAFYEELTDYLEPYFDQGEFEQN